MTRQETISFEFRRYRSDPLASENELVAQLPGLLITQFPASERESPDQAANGVVLRFDFVDDWYSVLAFLDSDKQPTGRYHISMQTPLMNDGGKWRGNNLILGVEISPNGSYLVTGEEDFCAAVEEGWMRVYAAAKAREALRKLCLMLDEGCLPQEVMDAVCG